MASDLGRDKTVERDAAAGLQASGPDGVPRHIGIIMDGNGRWARARGLPRVEGHRRGVQALRAIVRRAQDRGVRWLTVFSFSSENWKRPLDEVNELLGLLKIFIRRDLAELNRQGVRVKVIGDRDSLSWDIAALLDEAEAATAGNAGLTLVIAFNYGARDEILRAARLLAADVAAGRLAEGDITEAALGARLHTAGMPDPDLIIRTSGEQRLSNFLLWQSAYTEFVFVPTFWPDFDAAALDAAIAIYSGRERRFGGLKAGTGR